MSSPEVASAPLRVRHIKKADLGGTSVLGHLFVPQDLEGINGEHGWQSGSYERRLYEEGTSDLMLPNVVGGDGVLHRKRFLIAANRALYRPGDEWIELYREDNPGKPLFVGTPMRAKLGRTIEVTSEDALSLLKKVRESSACFWRHAPRDVWEHYTGVWRALLAEDFAGWYTPGGHAGGTAGSFGSINYAAAGGASTVAPILNKPGQVRLRAVGGVGTTGSATMESAAALVTLGQTWRVEVTISRLYTSGGVGTYPGLEFGVMGVSGGPSNGKASLRTRAMDGGPPESWNALLESTPGYYNTGGGSAPVELGGQINLAIESRERWLFFYVNGKLLGTAPQPIEAGNTARVFVWATATSTASGSNVCEADVSSMTVRKHEPFLLRGADKGDYRLPGSPPEGGLVGTYFSDQDLHSDTGGGVSAITGNYLHLLGPLRKPYTSRVDDPLDFFGASASSWPPPGPPGGVNFSVRWTGAIYLDLDNYDYALQVNIDRGRVRLWVGKTRWGEQLINSWDADQNAGSTTFTTTWLKAGNSGGSSPSGTSGSLNGMKSGWYPIVMEYSMAGPTSGGGPRLRFERSDAVGAFAVVGSDAKVKTSSVGIYDNQPRNESHYDVLKALSDNFGYQYTCEPRSLESGEFPGQAIPRIRQGRDTDYILNETEEFNPQTELDAAGVADALMADAAGLADPDEGAQLRAEVLNLPELDNHILVHQEYDMPSDVSDPMLLLQRLNTLLTLRSAPWETVQAAPRGVRELRDYFPVTGAAALFGWEPGDGIRMDFPTIEVKDGSPRQILGAQWPVRPGGLGRPQVTFRQRPRSFATVLRDFARAQRANQRNYQGQLVTLVGSEGGNGGHANRYSTVNIPASVHQIVRATAVIQGKRTTFGLDDTSGWTLKINDNSAKVVYRPGRYDVTDLVRRYQRADQRMVLHAEKFGSATGRIKYTLELLVRV